MKLSHAVVPALRTTILMLFLASNVFVLGYFWVGAGGAIPVIAPHHYKLSFSVPTAHNLVHGSHATLAGVLVGRIDEIKARPDGHADVVMSLDKNAPLHEGARLELREKSLLGETYVDITDGPGPELPSESRIPDAQVVPAVNLDDVLQQLGPPQRANLASFLNSLGGATKDSHEGVSAALSGLGQLSREGKTALAALAEQKEPLTQLSGNMAAALRALDTRRGQIAQLVTSARTVTDATAHNAEQIKAVMTELPGVLGTARDASDDLTRLGEGLRPVVANVEAAAPSLTEALRELPATTAALRGSMAPLDETLDRSPRTLDRVPTVSDDLIDLLPNAQHVFDNVNPMLDYLQPYGRDIAPFFTSFGLLPQPNIAGDGTVFRVMPVLAKNSIKNAPVPMNLGPLNNSHPYQQPRQQQANPDGGDRPPRVR